MSGKALHGQIRVRHLASTGKARAIRQQAGVTLAELGEACAVTDITIHRWETGQRTPRGERALRYLAALDTITAALDAINSATPPPCAIASADTSSSL